MLFEWSTTIILFRFHSNLFSRLFSVGQKAHFSCLKPWTWQLKLGWHFSFLSCETKYITDILTLYRDSRCTTGCWYKIQYLIFIFILEFLQFILQPYLSMHPYFVWDKKWGHVCQLNSLNSLWKKIISWKIGRVALWR